VTASVSADREHTADRLLHTSAQYSYDPVIDIDWSAPAVPGRFWLPPHRSSLYGTRLWDGLDPAQQVELTKHEVASAASAGIWFETILMQMLVRAYYDMDPTTRHAQYALTEVADECRHSVMFGRMLEAMGVAQFPARPVDHLLGRYLKASATGPHMYAAILIAEEVLDAFQREIMADESLQPLIRMVSRIHVVEEARHVRYARALLADKVAGADPVSLAWARLALGRCALAVSNQLVHPRAYAAVGIDPKVGRASARRNPNFAATLRWSAEKAVAFFDELGLIKGAGAALWRRSGLI
jgi:hypothetical protein